MNKEIIRVSQVRDQDGNPKLVIFINRFKPAYLVKVTILATLLLSELLVGCIVSTLQVPKIQPGKTKTEQRTTQKSSGDFSSKTLAIECEVDPEENYIVVKLQGRIKKNESFAVIYRDPKNEKHILEVVKREEMITGGTQLRAIEKLMAGTYQISAMNVDTEEIVAQKTVLIKNPGR